MTTREQKIEQFLGVMTPRNKKIKEFILKLLKEVRHENN